MGELKKDWWIKPKQLGGAKLKVKKSVPIICKCGKHKTTLHVLDGKYSTMFCDTQGQYAWLETPDDNFIEKIRSD